MREKSIDVFLSELSSGAPVPGGGGASAAIGAMSAALLSMVANLTTGKKKYAEYQGDIERILADTKVLVEELTVLIEKDAEVFEPLSKAYGIPKEDPNREEILENALKVASGAPFEICEKILEASNIVEELVIKGSRLAISDVGVAAAAATAAVKGASMNVYINTKLMKDRAYANDLNRRTLEIVDQVQAKCDRAYEEVKTSLIPNE